MSISEIVDEGYRLQTSDLQGRSRRVIVSNVSLQGIEHLSPVLHFSGQTKRLVLNRAQSRDMILLTGSASFVDWIGRAIVLRPVTSGGELVIAIHGVGGRFLRAKPLHEHPPRDYSGWIVASLIVALLLTLSSVYVRENWNQLQAVIEQLLP